MGYKMLGWAVWRLGKRVARRKLAQIGTGPKVAAGVAVVGLVAAVAVARRGSTSGE